MLQLTFSGKAKLKTLQESNELHKLLFDLGYSYINNNKEYPKIKPYGIAWYKIENSLIIRKTNIEKIFNSYSAIKINLNKMHK
jgi:hypothetical protein